MAFDWDSFERALGEELHRSLAALGQSHPGQVFYAVALHGVYAELDGLLSLPQLGANTVEAGAAPDGSFYLDRTGQPATLLAEKELAPGSSYRPIQSGDVDEALRALAARLTDPHPIVRRLAVLSISYWKAAAKPYRPAIEALAQDPDETVRKIVAHVLQ